MTPERMAMTPAEAGVEGPAPSEWTPPEWTGEEVRRLAVVQSRIPEVVFKTLRGLADDVPAHELAVSQAKLAVSLAEQQLEYQEAELLFSGVEGANAEQRKAALVKAKRDDAEYQARLAKLREVQAKLAEVEHVAAAARHLEKFWHAFLATRQAEIMYLAGG
jgi:hypothetical protein